MDKITIFYVMLLLAMIIFYVVHSRKISKGKQNVKNTKTTIDSKCSATNCADMGTQVRVVKCYNPLTNTPIPVDSCSNLNMPPAIQSCVNQNCVDWTADNWTSSCNLCRQQTDPVPASKTVSRNVSCPSSDPSNCNQLPYDAAHNPRGKPVDSITCPDTVCSALSGHYVSIGPPDDVPLQGLSHISGNINYLSVLGNTISIPNGLIGNFMISIVWNGVSSYKSTNIPPVKYSNILPLNCFGAGTKSIVQNSATNSLGPSSILFFLMTFSIVDYGSSSKIVFDGSFSMPTSPSTADLFIIKINDNINLLCNPCVPQLGNSPLLGYHQLLTPNTDNVLGGDKLIFDSIGLSNYADTTSFSTQDLNIPYSSSTFLFILELSGTNIHPILTLQTLNINILSYFNGGKASKITNIRQYSNTFLYMFVFSLSGPSDGTIQLSGSIPANTVGDIFVIELDNSFTS